MKKDLLKELRKHKSIVFVNTVRSAILKSERFCLDSKDILFLENLILNNNFVNKIDELNYLTAVVQKNIQKIFLNIVENIYTKEELAQQLHTNIPNPFKTLSIQEIESLFYFLCDNLSSYTILFCLADTNQETQDEIFKEYKSLILGYKNSKNQNQNSLLDFINRIVLNNNINEIEFLKFSTLISNQNNYQYLDYLNHFYLSKFINIVFNFLNNISKNETCIIQQNPNNALNKRGYYFDFMKSFLNKIEKINKRVFIKAYKHTGYLNAIMNKLLKSKFASRQINSHYIQGAYLEKIIGIQAISNFCQDLFEVNNPQDNNSPYRKPFFYGYATQSNKGLLEGKFSNVENNIDEYLEYISKHYSENCNKIIISKKNKQNNLIPFRKKTKLDINKEVKCFFLVGYIRTPNFIDDFIESFYNFANKVVTKEIKKTNFLTIEKDIDKIILNASYHEIATLSKTVQYALCDILLELLEHKDKNIEFKYHIFENHIKKHSIMKIDRFINDMNGKPYLNLVFNKIKAFIFDNYLNIDIKEVDFNIFSYNVFIPKLEGMSIAIFEDAQRINLAYFPVSKNKLLVFYDPKNNNAINKKETLKQNCLIEFKNIPFTVERI